MLMGFFEEVEGKWGGSYDDFWFLNRYIIIDRVIIKW